MSAWVLSGAWPQPPADILSPGGGALLSFARIWLKGMKGILKAHVFTVSHNVVPAGAELSPPRVLSGVT